MKAMTHQVQVSDHKTKGTRWYACEVIGRHPAPTDFVKQGFPTDWYDVRLKDGTEFHWCNPICVREKATKAQS